MELPVALQLTQAVTSVVAGIGISLIYDLFYIIRKQCTGRLLPQMLDLLFSGIALAVLFFVMQRVGGGAFRLFMLLAAALGAALYFSGPSIGIRFVLGKVAQGIRRSVEWLLKPLKLLVKPIKKFLQIFRNLFQKMGRWSKIHYADRSVVKQSGDPAGQEGDAVETKQGSYLYKDYRNCHSRICGRGVDGSVQTGAGGADASDTT